MGEEEVEVNGLWSSFFSSSLSFGENAAPNGLCESSGDVAFGLAGEPFRLDCDGGVDPEENFELKLEIHEFRRPPSGFGAVFCVAGDGVDGGGFCSALFSGGGGGLSDSVDSDALFSISLFGTDLSDDGGRAGLLFDRDRRCGFDDIEGGSFSATDLSLRTEETDFVR